MNKQLSLFACAPEVKPTRHESWTISIDGASRGNPGPSGAGIYIESKQGSPQKYAFYLGIKTNNQAEYLALVLGLYLINTKISTHNSSIMIISDSQLLVKQMQGHYRVKNQALMQLYRLAQTFIKDKKCVFKHVLREKNKEADALANAGIDKKNEIPNEFLELLRSHDITFCLQ